MDEEWRPVTGYEGLYEVSNLGRVKSLFRYKKVLKNNKANTGYCMVELFKNKQGKMMLVHRLVAQAFIPNPNNYPQVNHIDENRENNNVANLEWCTAQYNMTYNNGHCRRAKNIDFTNPKYLENIQKAINKRKRAVNQYDLSGNFIKSFESIIDVSRDLKINSSHIGEVCRGSRRSSGGFIWKYVEKE